ncbi:unnamed protein product [Brachionus calyciflorus]|uniref:Peptidase C-terminal archaeal/bacterial domain-containing protein n=1 Tax=Brachionus calyciflorus TaxID=104777 RepID=A0A814K056_9BILA|nr:unnamed protein product [Brachionus calyciflorus]
MKQFKYFLTSLILIVSLQFSLNHKVLYGDQIKEEGSCEMPNSLFKLNESINDNLSNLENLTTDFFKVSFTLKNHKTLYKPNCFDPQSTYLVYKFEIEDPIIPNQKNYYNYYDYSNKKYFELSLNKEPDFIGSFKNPKPLDKDEFFIISKQISDEALTKNSYYTKLDCSKEKSPSVVYSFEVPSNTEVFLGIKLLSTDGSNKLDTVLGIVDSDGQPVENWCNDDSHYIGGLSSSLNGLLTSGSYRLIASGYDFESYGNFRLEFSSKLYKIGSIGQISLEDRLIEKFNSSFSTNKDLFNCECCLKKETNKYVVIPMKVSKAIYGFIKVYGADKKNKLDTFIEIRDDNLREIPKSNYCNDDSNVVGGLSSFLSVFLPSGEYRLVLGVTGSKSLEPFTVEFNLNSV